jgi:hypothetical protein
MNPLHRAVPMKRSTLAVTLASALLLNTAAAQDSTTHQSVFKAPVFLVMPGGLTSCSISCPASKSKTDFNARFQTVVPTATPWLALVAGAQWGWADTSAHGPLGFFGGIIPLVPLNNAMNGWLSLSVDPLGVTSGPGGRGTNFVLEGAAVLNLGAKMMKTMPVFRGFGAYFLIDQQLSRVPRDLNGDKDYWNPALVWGGLLQLAPWP